MTLGECHPRSSHRKDIQKHPQLPWVTLAERDRQHVRPSPRATAVRASTSRGRSVLRSGRCSRIALWTAVTLGECHPRLSPKGHSKPCLTPVGRSRPEGPAARKALALDDRGQGLNFPRPISSPVGSLLLDRPPDRRDTRRVSPTGLSPKGAKSSSRGASGDEFPASCCVAHGPSRRCRIVTGRLGTRRETAPNCNGCLQAWPALPATQQKNRSRSERQVPGHSGMRSRFSRSAWRHLESVGSARARRRLAIAHPRRHAATPFEG